MDDQFYIDNDLMAALWSVADMDLFFDPTQANDIDPPLAALNDGVPYNECLTMTRNVFLVWGDRHNWSKAYDSLGGNNTRNLCFDGQPFQIVN